MRADRLLTILLLLQTKGKMKARELAAELEVSERTIYRDIDALSIAGVPVYSDPGPDGGYALLDSFRTDLTGLSEGEVRALFMLSVPAALADLGVSQELKSALLKMSAAVPDTHRLSEERVRQRIHIDSSWWRQGEERVPHLKAIHKAIWDDQRLFVRYRPPFAVEIERSIEPYGLVAKAGVWYMVYCRNERLNAHRVSDLFEVWPLDESFERRADFDLAEFWSAWCVEHESQLTVFSSGLRCPSSRSRRHENVYLDLVGALRYWSQERLGEVSPIWRSRSSIYICIDLMLVLIIFPKRWRRKNRGSARYRQRDLDTCRRSTSCLLHLPG